MKNRVVMTALVATTGLLWTKPGLAACLGDCNCNGVISAGEITKIISIIIYCDGAAVGCPAVPGTDKQCTAADKNQNGFISAGELTNIINNTVFGWECSDSCTPTPTFTPTTTPTPELPHWSVSQRGNILEIGYGSGMDFPQYAALHLDSSYFRMVCGPQCDWGTSAVLIPPFWELQEPLRVVWEETEAPSDQIQELACGGGYLFARTLDDLWRLNPNTAQRDQLDPVYVGKIYTIDIDDSVLYVGGAKGVSSSTDWGSSFSPEYVWGWDPTIDIDCHNGYCWSLITKWGSWSGPIRKTPDGQWTWKGHGISWPSIGLLYRIVIDTVDPTNIAYTSSYRTTDGGENWIAWSSWAAFTKNDDGTPALYNYEQYSSDHGESWQPLGMYATAFAADQESDHVFALSPPYGVRRGRLDNWHYYGLAEKDLRSICVDDRYVFVSDENGKIYRAHTDAEDTPIVYRQGAPVNARWTEEGSQLVLSISGTISGLTINGQVRLDPPQGESITAYVSMETEGNVSLAPKPYETFKPVFLSSMRVASNLWDTQGVYVSGSTLPIPESGWIIYPPISMTPNWWDRGFSLIGGTSDWKVNAPTIEVQISQPSDVDLDITGWVTPSTDPNDDNVGLWAATDKVLPSWSYAITTSKPQP